jgi:hypothetical protein
MKNDDRAAFAEMLQLVAEQYGKPMSPDLIGLYFNGLRHLSLEEVKAALDSHVKNTEIGQFMPKIADLIRAVEGTTEQAAYAQLALVNSNFNGSSAQGTLDPIALAVVRDMGGWHAIGQRQEAEWQSFGCKDFLKRYAIYAARGDANSPGYLPGYFEKLESK